MHTEVSTQKVSPLEYAEILQFYAEQMHHLDALEIDAYAATFTTNGIIDHRHANYMQHGRQAITDNATSILPTYSKARSRHWNSDYFVRRASNSEGSYYYVRYASLVTHQADDGSGIAIKDPFIVTDTVLREGDTFLVDKRIIEQPGPGALDS